MEHLQLYHGDCLEVMKTLPDECVDLIITSPPYNLGKTHHTGNNIFKSYSEYNDNMPEPLYQQWQIEILRECFRILKPSGSLFYNHKNRIKKGVKSRLRMVIENRLCYQARDCLQTEVNFDKILFTMTEKCMFSQIT